MRLLILPYAAWMGLLPPAAPFAASGDLPRFLATAGLIGSLTVFVYRLGVWRQEMENTKSNVGAEVRCHREESAVNFARIEQRLDGIDHVLTDFMEYKQKASRVQHRVARRLECLEEQRK
jgi:hypothetical protein